MNDFDIISEVVRQKLIDQTGVLTPPVLSVHKYHNIKMTGVIDASANSATLYEPYHQDEMLFGDFTIYTDIGYSNNYGGAKLELSFIPQSYNGIADASKTTGFHLPLGMFSTNHHGTAFHTFENELLSSLIIRSLLDVDLTWQFSFTGYAIKI